MMKFYYKPPSLLKKLYPNSIWETSDGNILLSFDDGPEPDVTTTVLKKLDENKLKAIFFCVGENAERFGDLISDVSGEGHTVALHGWDHKIVAKLNRKELFDEIECSKNIISSKSGTDVKYFRPPYGRIFPWQAKSIAKLGLTNVMWSLVTYDYEGDFEKVKFAIDNYLSKNSIVVFHDSLKTEKIITRSIDYLLETADKKGFSIGSPELCLK